MIFILGIFLLLSSFGYLMLLWKLWLIDGTMDAPVAILLGMGALIFVGMGIRQASIPLLWLMVVLMGGGSLLFITLDDYYEKNSRRQRLLDDIKKLQLRTELNAADWRAWRDLGAACMQLELFDQAIDAYKNAIRLDPPDVMKIRKSLNDALDSRTAGKMSDVSICPNCNAETPRNSKVCVHCGQPMHFEFVKFISTPDVYGDIIRYVILSLAGVTILVLVLSQFSLEVKAVIAMATVIVCAFLIWRSIENV